MLSILFSIKLCIVVDTLNHCVIVSASKQPNGNIMSNVISGGAKFHLMNFRGVKLVNGKPTLKADSVARVNKSCGGRYSGAMNAVDFNTFNLKHPDSACKKCLAKFKELMAEAKAISNK